MSMKIFAPHAADAYKAGHLRQYATGTEYVYSNFTARGAKLASVLPDFDNKAVFMGLHGVLQWMLRDLWNESFFSQPRSQVLARFQRRMDYALGPGAVDTKHMGALHDLGYLPLRIKALPEGSRVNLRVPYFTVVNTDPRFYWLTNYVESQISAECWKTITNATVAYEFRRLLDAYCDKTGGIKDFVRWQGHDFSMRGMSGIFDSAQSGMGHLSCFTGTDTFLALDFAEDYYGADASTEALGGSVPATEHSVVTMEGPDQELEFVRRLITKIYPRGVVSSVSDSYDFWWMMTTGIKMLHDDIMARQPDMFGLNKFVVRPDSGVPDLIICGDPNAPQGSPESKGAIQCLWDEFGGSLTSTGHKLLDPHVGLIYGDAITLPRAQTILARLDENGFCSSNVVFGIGSYCVTPDTPILCSDLVWRPAGTLEVGQEILAFDENPNFGNGRHAVRTYTTAKIVHNTPAEKICCEVTTDIGDPITASEDHPWLVFVANRNRDNTYIGENKPIFSRENQVDYPRTPGLAWKTTAELRPGDQIAFIGRPWEVENTRAAGWLAGMFDGEGSISRSTGEERIPHFKVNISQNPGLLLDRVKRELEARGFTYYMNVRECPQVVLTGGWLEVLRFLGTVWPDRLRTKLPEMFDRMPALAQGRTYKLATVQDVQSVGTKTTASIQTSCGTFITGGYLSHNTYQHNTRDSLGHAYKSTWGVVNGVAREIFKDPKTDSGLKKSAKGLIRVEREGDDFVLYDQQTVEQEAAGALEVVFEDGRLTRFDSLSSIRQRLLGHQA